jgi:large subunit ribosomal protein L4
MKVSVYDKSGKKTSKSVELSDSIYGIEPNDHAIYLDVKLIMANKRQGTHKSKERAEITGSTRKIKKQKGTGTARAGSIKSGVFRGGGRIFGPRPRNYGFKLNKKTRVLARKSALTYKAQAESICIMEDLKFDTPKTKDFLNILSKMDFAGKKTLFVTAENDRNVVLSSRNLKGANVITASNLNTYDILNANNVIISAGAVEKIDNLFS